MTRFPGTVLLVAVLAAVWAGGCTKDGGDGAGGEGARPRGEENSGLAGGSGEASSAPTTSGEASGPPEVRFREVARESGIDFRHRTGFDGRYFFPEITTPGCAIFDADGDGREDVFLVDGGSLAPDVLPEEARPRHRLYRNLGDGRFEDVTLASGIVGGGYGQGVAVADYDGDGDLDLYVTNVGPNQLFLNMGGGRFREVAAEIGVDDRGWSTSAAFGDLDGDDDLDLYVANYCLWSPAAQVPCKTPSGEPDYCNPKAFEPATDTFYRNRGDGTFENATAASGISRVAGRGLGVAIADFDGDGRADIYVANDGDPNFLWLGEGDGTFREDGLLSGAALDAQGNTEASMGVTLADLENDGDWDIFLTHMTGETNTLYRNDGRGLFEDWVLPGLIAASTPFTGFGTLFFDAELDGDDDLYIANGAVVKASDAAREPWPYAQRDQFFLCFDDHDFRELLPTEANWLAGEAVGRGAAFGDLDADGDIDVVVANAEGPPFVLRNESRRGQHRWVGVRLAQAGRNREAIGAVVRVEYQGASVSPTLSRARRVSRDGSYLSSNEARVAFGLPVGTRAAAAVVRWPDGVEETVPLPDLDRDYVVTRAMGGTPSRAVALGPGSGTPRVDGGDPSVPIPGPSDPLDVPSPRPLRADGELPPLPGLQFSAEVPPLPELSSVDPPVAARVRNAREVLLASRDAAVAWKDYGLALYADAGDDLGARLALEQAVLRSGDDVRSTYLLAVIESRRGEVARARAYLERAVAQAPDYHPARMRLAEQLREGGELDAAEAELAQVLARSPQDPDALEGRGRVARARGNLPAAIALLEQAVQVDPASRGAHYELGLALRAAGETDRARVALEAATRAGRKEIVDPWLAELYAGRGGANQLLTEANRLRLAGDFEAAVRSYAEYTERKPEDPIGWSNLAAAHRDQGELDAARKAVDRALELDPRSARTLALKAAIVLGAGETETARGLLAQAVEIDPTLAQAWLDLGNLQAAASDRFGAAQSFQRYVELRPADANGHFQLGEIAVAIGELDRAVQAFEQAVRQDSTQVRAHFRLGGLALKRNEGSEAEARFRAALRQHPDWPEAHLGLAHALRLQGDEPAALAEAERALALRPDSEVIQRAVGAFRNRP